MFHYLDHVRRFWIDLIQHDKHDMQKMNYIMMKTLELKASSMSTSDNMILYRQLRKGKIFSAFNLNRRMKIWAKLQTWESLILTLWTFFEDFKYIKACVHWMKSLIKMSFRETLCYEHAWTGQSSDDAMPSLDLAHPYWTLRAILSTFSRCSALSSFTPFIILLGKHIWPITSHLYRA